jgi:hypothetical protein
MSGKKDEYHAQIKLYVDKVNTNERLLCINLTKISPEKFSVKLKDELKYLLIFIA